MFRRLFRTVRGRYVLIISFLVISILVVLSFFSYQMIRTSIESRGRAHMDSAIRMISQQLDEEYTQALQISQHMTSRGVVGKQMNEMMRAKDMYELGEAKRKLGSNLQTVTAIGKQVELALYYSPEEGSITATTFMPKDNFNPAQGLPIARQTRSVTFHAIHESKSRFSNHPVVSVAWPDTFLFDRNLIIYVEVRTSVPELLKDINEEDASGYILFQLTKDGEICYCSHQEYANQDASVLCFDGSELFGMSNHLVWCKNQSNSGYTYVLAIPRSTFTEHMFQWIDYLIIGILIAIILICIAVALFNHLILRKLQLIVDAVNAVSRPELFMTSKRTGMTEYDNLMERFEDLLEYARQLIDEVRVKEEQKSKLELETLYYQINPHFLMNSLNSLYWLARLNKQKEISDYVHHLMEILNYSLGRGEKDPTLRRELDISRDYLALEQMKHRFTVIYEVEEGAYLDSPTPRLFLQPVVENAVSHGMDTDGHLKIIVQPDESGAVIVIDDDGCGIEPDLIQEFSSLDSIKMHGGIGLRYTASMLRQFYGEDCTLLLENKPEGGARATIHLSMWKEASHDTGTDY